MTAQVRCRRNSTREVWHWQIGLVGIIAFSLSIATGMHAHAVEKCDAYRHPSFGFDHVESKLKESVLTIKYDKEVGTAFLIDRSRGLFLTAHHVVKKNDTQATEKVQGRFASEGSKVFNLSVLKEDANLDVALLQTDDLSQLQDRDEFELSFHVHKPQRVGFLSTAYGTIDDPKVTRTLSLDKFGYDDVQRYGISIPVNFGDSGAPIMKTDNGLVIAIVIERITDKRAIAQPMVNLRKFLKKDSMKNLPKQMSQVIDESLKGFDEDVWHSMFRANEGPLYSNFRLAGMIQSIWENKPWPKLYDKIKGCEVFFVGINRGLGHYAGYLQAFATTSENRHASKAKALFDAAEEKSKIGEHEFARILYETASELYANAIAALLVRESGSGYLAALLSGSGFTRTTMSGNFAKLSEYTLADSSDTAVDAEQYATIAMAPFAPEINIERIVVPRMARQKNAMGILFHDYQTSRLRAANLSPRGFSSLVARDTFVYAVWGSQVSHSRRYRGLNYQAMGDALVRLERFDEAATAYASAWQYGVTKNVILQNYRYARSLAQNRAIAMNMELENEIATVAGMNSKTLRGLVTEIGAYNW